MLRRRPSAAGNPAYRDDAVIGIANSFGNRIGVRETTMAKGQKRGNREIKKPKSAKTPTGVAVSILSPKGISPSASMPKKK